MSLNDLLQSQQAVEMKALENENKIKGEKVQRLKQENESIKVQLREEKEKSEELLSQVSGWIWKLKIISKGSRAEKSYSLALVAALYVHLDSCPCG